MSVDCQFWSAVDACEKNMGFKPGDIPQKIRTLHVKEFGNTVLLLKPVLSRRDEEIVINIMRGLLSSCQLYPPIL